MKDPGVVIFFFAGCFVRPTDGCHVRACQDLEMLVASGQRVVVYSYRNHGQWPWGEKDIEAFGQRFPAAELVLDDWGFQLKLLQKLKSLAASIGGDLMARVLGFRLPGASPGLDRLRGDPALRMAVVSYPWGQSHLNGRPAPRIVIDTHDLQALEQIQAGPAGRMSPGALAALRKEMFYLSLADQIWSISYAERWFIEELLGAEKVRLVPPALSSWTGAAEPSTATALYDLVFVGSDNRWNGEALTGFLRACAAWKLPLTIGVAGAVCKNADVAAAAAQVPGAKLLGFVDDLDAFYAAARASVCPVEGTGTKIKLIESLRAGRPVFAATGALAGLVPGYEHCVFPIDAEVIGRVLHDPATLAAAQAAAGRYSEAYEFDRVAAQVKTFIEPLL